MSDKPTEIIETTSPVRLDIDIVQMLRVVSAHTGETMTEIVAPILRKPITRLHRKVLAELNEQVAGGEG